MKAIGRAIGLDVHLDFCEIAICEEGKVRSAGRVASTPEALGVLAESLLPTGRVALEVTGSWWEILRILEPHVARVIVVSPDETGIAGRVRRPTAWTRRGFHAARPRGAHVDPHPGPLLSATRPVGRLPRGAEIMPTTRRMESALSRGNPVNHRASRHNRKVGIKGVIPMSE